MSARKKKRHFTELKLCFIYKILHASVHGNQYLCLQLGLTMPWLQGCEGSRNCMWRRCHCMSEGFNRWFFQAKSLALCYQWRAGRYCPSVRAQLASACLHRTSSVIWLWWDQPCLMEEYCFCDIKLGGKKKTNPQHHSVLMQQSEFCCFY